MKHTIFLRRALALLLLLTLTLTMALPTLAASSATAADMRLVKTEGKVTVGNQSGKTLSIRDNMKLYSGYTISTDAESYAWLTLDAEKAVKLDANSALEVRKKGKKLELLLVDGKIYFDVSAPLDDGETMNIRTSTMVTGIRGTSGIIATSGSVSSATLLTGAAQVTSLTTGESMLVQAGTMGVVTPTSMAAQPVSSIDGFAAKEIQSNPDQAKAVEEATGQSVSNADAQLASDQAKAADSQQQLDALMQDVNGAAASSAEVSGISDQAMAELLKTGEITRPGSTPAEDNVEDGGEDVETPNYIYVKTALMASELTALFNTYDNVYITDNGSVTITEIETFEIPANKALIFTGSSGIGGKLIVDGMLTVSAEAVLRTDEFSEVELNNSINVNGTWENASSSFTGTTDAGPIILVYGTFENTADVTLNADISVYSGATATLNGIVVARAVICEGTVNVYGALTTTLRSFAQGSGIIHIHKDASLTSTFDFYITGGTVTNDGTFYNQWSFEIDATGTLQNNGVFYNVDKGSISGEGSIAGNPAIDISTMP